MKWIILGILPIAVGVISFLYLRSYYWYNNRQRWRYAGFILFLLVTAFGMIYSFVDLLFHASLPIMILVFIWMITPIYVAVFLTLLLWPKRKNKHGNK